MIHVKKYRSQCHIPAFIPRDGFLCTYWIIDSVNAEKRDHYIAHIARTAASPVKCIDSLEKYKYQILQNSELPWGWIKYYLKFTNNASCIIVKVPNRTWLQSEMEDLKNYHVDDIKLESSILILDIDTRDSLVVRDF